MLSGQLPDHPGQSEPEAAPVDQSGPGRRVVLQRRRQHDHRHRLLQGHEDDILEITSQEEIDGVLWSVTPPLNGETTKYKGLELGFVKNSFGDIHPWLEQVGVSANAMWVRGETTYLYKGAQRVRDDLLYQADFSGNAAVFYGFDNGSEIRVAYNRQGRYVEEYGANPWEDNVTPPFDTFDLTAKWAVAKQWQLRLEGRNIFSNNRERYTGPNHQHKRTELEIGSSWFLRATYSY